MYRIMIKTHEKTGLKYLCVTSKENFEVYRGSGVYWKNHLKKYGNNIHTEVLYETESLDNLYNEGVKYSALYDVVESDEWANLIPETGYSKDKQRGGWFGWYKNLSKEEKQKRNKNISEKVKQRYKLIMSEELSSILSKRRLSLSDEKRQIRKIKIQATYQTGKHDHLFERYSKERMGKNNPTAKQIEIDGVIYGSIQDASRELNIPAHKLYRMRKRRLNSEN